MSRAMKEEQETGGRSMISDWENERVLRTKRACALAERGVPPLDRGTSSPLFAHGCLLLLGNDRGRDVQKVASCTGPGDPPLQWLPTSAGTPTNCATRSTLIKHSTSGTKTGRSSVYFCGSILA